MNSGLYSLMVRNLDTDEIVVLPIEDRETKEVRKKVNISSIDRLTSYFKDEQELINRLYDRQYINFKNADIYISYKHKGTEKFLQPLYKQFEYMRTLFDESESQLDEKKDSFIYYQDTIFSELNKVEVRQYILVSCPTLNSKIREHIDLAYYSETLEEVNYFKKKVISDLTNYRTLRDMVMNINEFYNPELKMDRLLKSEGRRRVLAKQMSNEELLAKTMNINIPSNYKQEENEKKYDTEDSDDNELKTDNMYNLSDDEALALGIDKNKIDEYVGKAK